MKGKDFCDLVRQVLTSIEVGEGEIEQPEEAWLLILTNDIENELDK